MKLPFVAAQLTLLRPPLPELWPFIIWPTGSNSFLMNVLRGLHTVTMSGAEILGTRIWGRQDRLCVRRGAHLPWSLTAHRRSHLNLYV